MRTIQAIIVLAFLVMVGVFAVQNMNVITVKFFNWSATGPVALLIVAVYFVGMLSGWGVVALLTRSIRRVAEARDDS